MKRRRPTEKKIVTFVALIVSMPAMSAIGPNLNLNCKNGHLEIKYVLFAEVFAPGVKSLLLLLT